MSKQETGALKQTILVVEDNDDHAELITRCFEDRGVSMDMRRVGDGEAALAYIRGEGIYVDRHAFPQAGLVLLDLRLPKVDGLEVLRQIKVAEGTRHIPVVMLTSSTNERDLMQAYRSFVNSYLVKPLEYEDFVNLMSDLGGYWMDLNQPPSAE